MTQPAANPMDAMMAFWKDAWARAGQAGGATAASAGDPLGWMPTPDQVRRMQSAFLDALTQASDQYMRSPQFLDSMKASLDSGLQMRRQMEELMRRQMSETLGATGHSPGYASGHASGDVAGALHEMESRIMARLEELSSRIDALASRAPESMTPESDGGPRPRRSTKG